MDLFIEPGFTLDSPTLPSKELVPYIITANGKPILKRGGNGQVFPLTYKTQEGADRVLVGVRDVIPAAQVTQR